MWFHIKLKKDLDNPLSKTTFWLGGETEKDIYEILKRKHKINKKMWSGFVKKLHHSYRRMIKCKKQS